MIEGYETALPASSKFVLTKPSPVLTAGFGYILSHLIGSHTLLQQML
jgi:hypothetical protein